MGYASLASIFGGLGLFFIGVKLIGTHLKQISGRRFRKLMMRAVDRPWRAGSLGVISGALTQSTSAVTFIAISLISAGALSVPKAIPIVSWANLGTSALVFVASFDLLILVLYLLGVVGTAYYFNVDKSERFRHIVGALLGVALLFLGLQFIKSGAAPLNEMASVQEFLAIAAHSYLLVFIIGAALAMVAQSSSTVSVVAVAMTSIGLFSMNQTMVIIYGASLGSALSVWLLTANLGGTPRQLAIFQVLLKLVGVVIMLGLFVAETRYEVPLVRALVEWGSSDIAIQSALVYLLFQLVASTLMTLVAGPTYRLLKRLSPSTPSEEMARPQFIYEQALDDVDSAIVLADKEQMRLVRFLPDYLPVERASAPTGSVDALHEANRALSEEVGAFLTELMDRHPDRGALEEVVNLQGRNTLLRDLQDSLRDFAQALQRAGSEADTEAIRTGLSEGLHVITLTLVDAAASADPEDVALLQSLASERADLMERIRYKLLREGQRWPYAVHEALFGATSLFERILWLMRRYALLLTRNADAYR